MNTIYKYLMLSDYKHSKILSEWLNLTKYYLKNEIKYSQHLILINGLLLYLLCRSYPQIIR